MSARNRVKLNITLAPDVVDALKARSSATDAPIARIVDRAVRAHLGLQEPADEPGVQ